MPSVVWIQFAAPVLAALAGGAVGWWLRGMATRRRPTAGTPQPKQQASQMLQSLQAAADTVRDCIEQHADCIRTIQAELKSTTATEPAIITQFAESIIASTGLVQHQCNDIRGALNTKRKEIHDFLAGSQGLLFTFGTLDRQQQAYNQVLASLEVLAAELAGDIKGHGQRLQKISGGLEAAADTTPAGVESAIGKILDATDHMQKRIVAAEQQIADEAETVQMQAILTHADLLTSLPNRRALEAELLRAAQNGGRSPLASVIFIDLDDFARVNNEYGHQGGDVILRQAAAIIKKLARGRDLVSRFHGDTFAVMLNQTTLHDALPAAERIRHAISDAVFSHGNRPLRVTASIGVAQLRADEMRAGVTDRVGQAVAAAQQAGGNTCFRHDGESCVAISAAFQSKTERAGELTESLAALWRDSSDLAGESSPAATNELPAHDSSRQLTGRSLFAANLSRRLSEWKRGGATVSVAVLRIDQMDELIARFGEKGQSFLREVMGRLLEAVTRDMDERCEFEDGLFALILPGTDEANAMAVADRLLTQIRQCKVRMGRDLWSLTGSIGIAHCTVAERVMDIMLSAERAMHTATHRGGDTTCIGEAISDLTSAVKL